MAYPTSRGLAQEQPVLLKAARPLLPQLDKRGITEQTFTEYETRTTVMKEKVAGKGGKISDQKQLTANEAAARKALQKEMRNIQEGVKKTFPKGSPQWKEFYIGEKDNSSTSRLLEWTIGIGKGWDKYKPQLIQKGKLLQTDKDALDAAAAALKAVDTDQESAKTVDSPEASAEKKQAINAVIEIADSIYTAIEREFRNDPATLSKFASIKELRFAPVVGGDEQAADASQTPSAASDTTKK
jgi:hypothetical protein